MQQAILTKFLPATNTRGARIKATCERGSITIPYPYELNPEEGHKAAVNTLTEKFATEDFRRTGIDTAANPWKREFVTGALEKGGGPRNLTLILH